MDYLEDYCLPSNRNTYQVYDDVLGDSMLISLIDSIKSGDVPWHYTGTSYTGDYETAHFGQNGAGTFSYLPPPTEQLNGFLKGVSLTMLDNVGIPISNLITMRLAMITKQNSSNILNESHVDSSEDHFVGLLYLNDSDGDTIIYNETIDEYRDLWANDYEFYDKHLKGNLTEMVRVSPKTNRLVIFNGKHFHASSTPTTTSRRLAMNINFK
jgi:hypothetical protein